MKTTLYMAISVDGYIAKTNFDTGWISELDFEIFEEKVKKSGCVIMGNTTFKEVGITPGVKHIVLSRHKKESIEENIYFSDSPHDALRTGEKYGFEKILIIGGGECNGSFLKENLIDEIIIDVQPIILGKGIKLFEGIEKFVELDFIEHKKLNEGLNMLKYTVKK